ncbi:MAG TPA: hypothetical protein VFG81_06355 [Anaerolineales bacterium]|jgi:hypothetical protein|nr:hypothetical protein [Anaerolineales bacterium]
MRSSSYLLSLVFLLITASCAPASIEETATPTPTLIPILSPTATIVPTSVSTPTLQAGQWSYVFYHEGLEQVVLVNGGPERGKPADDPLELWSWDGTQWSLISADENGPTWRNWPAAAYDNTRDTLVIHGGLQPGRNFDETWEWDGRAWSHFTIAGPGAREGALMSYDAARSNMILFGGSTPDLEIHGETWKWDGGTWTPVSDTGPARRFPGGMVYDAARQEMLMYSGHFAESTGEFVQYDDLWAWDGSSWRELLADTPTPGHRTHAGFVYDPVTESVLLIGSGSDTFLGDVWSWDGTQWREIPTSNTPVRTGLNIAYDPKRDRFVLFGGVDRPGGKALDDTWEWDRGNWICASNCP